MPSMMLERVRGNPGFATGLHLSALELEEVKGLVSDHLAHQVHPSLAGLLQHTPLERYHEIADRLPHAQLLLRTSRILPQSAVTRIREMSLFDQLEREYGRFAISDEEGMGRESISLRLVRPRAETDVGSLHSDEWFWKLYDYRPIPAGLQRVKVWVAVCCEPGQAGLLLAPNSHEREWKHTVFDLAGMLKPRLAEEKPDLELFHSNPGDGVTFNFRLLHGGAVTTGNLTRVSLECTILVPDEVYGANWGRVPSVGAVPDRRLD